VYYVYITMNKKQTIRTLGSIESKQTKQIKQPTQTKQTKKKLNKELDLESDDNIEINSDNDLDEIDLVVEEPIIKDKSFLNAKSNPKGFDEPIKKKKRVISDEQKKVLVDRLAYARSLRKKESENKKVLEKEYLQQKEKEINDRLLKKFTSLQRKKENEMMKKYMTKPKEESEEEEIEEEVIIKKTKPKPKKKIVYQYEENDDDNERYKQPIPVPPATSVFFC